MTEHPSQTAPRIIYSTASSPEYIPPLALSPHQVVVGPNFPDVVETSGRVLSRRVARNFDAAALVRDLPTEQRPDLFVALVDAWVHCLPRNLGALNCHTALVIADTHHGIAPLTNLLTYTAMESYRRIAVTHDPHHLHWFAEAGLSPVACHLNLNVHDHPVPFATERNPSIAFVGQAGAHHPRRRRLLDVLIQAGLPLLSARATPAQAANLYAAHQLTFNCSLNGDLNMRVFEVLSAGGCLLTDRLSAASGLDGLFRDGVDLILYDDAGDLVEKARHYLDRPDLCLRIAASGQQRYRLTHTQALRRSRFLDYALGSDTMARQVAAQDQRADQRCSRREPMLQLNRRAAAYQRVQELQRSEYIDRICITRDVPREYLDDLADLRHLRHDLPLGNGIRACLLIGMAETGLMLAAATPPADYLLLIDAGQDDIKHLNGQLERLGYRNIPGAQGNGGWLFTTKPETKGTPY